ncbi:hypothetical protein [Subdoligranulum variabile]|uniref:Uncharacterized protein n=1 Tax=Subdoligranulum variabile DSM 15176 TaxID=411471 RepID=D1PS99_9FIRM|nr:hypothetical protein [Subdoligranulum variabile]EFB74384.1 hypothetical protein SUBVAR_07282 [Subdoligranulum variabile DSM 15176]UWP69478.1 hypothetical protein NQ490_06420 [Subdoligranulum variabile]
MKGTRKRFRPWAGLAVLAAAALVLWGGVSLWLQSGWRTIVPTLHDQIGDASQLEGFTLSGQMGWNGHEDLLHFALEDGTVRAEMQLDAPQKAVNAGRYDRFAVSRICVVPPEDRDVVNEAATITGSGSDGSRFLSAPLERVLRMYILRLPDGTVIRLAAGEAPTDDYATAYATLVPESVYISDLNSDYRWADGSQSFETSWPYDPTGGSCFTLGAGYGVCWEKDFLGRAPGLYRADGLTDDEISALPRDGVLYDREVLCASTEFGTLEPFYCPEDAEEALAGASMADGSTLLLYRTADGMVCADLVNAAGSRTDHRELGTLEVGSDALFTDTTLLPRTTDGEAFLRINGETNWLVLLRAEKGAFTMAELVEDKDLVLPDAVVLNEAGDKILLAKGASVQYLSRNSQVVSPSGNGIELRVCELDTGHMTYLGCLQTGSERDWARWYQTRNLHADRFITFDTLQKDGGLLP